MQANHEQVRPVQEQAKQPLGPEEKKERKQQILTHPIPSVTRSIADAIMLKNQDIFMVAGPDGNVPLDANHGYGLYYHDCRYLNGYELRIAQTRPDVLVSNAAQGFRGVFELSNPEIRTPQGQTITKESIGCLWERLLDGSKLVLEDTFTFHNYGREEVRLPVSLTFQAGFEDIFVIRGLLPTKVGHEYPPLWKGDTLFFEYDGADRYYRSLSVSFSPSPSTISQQTALFNLDLGPRKDVQLRVSLTIAESPNRQTIAPASPKLDRPEVQAAHQRSSDAWVASMTLVNTDSVLVNDVLGRSLRDLGILRMHLEHREFFAAGIPWFVTLFGRDSLITALQTLAYDPSIAAETLRILASYQGQKADDWRDEQPGKILHELRVGELARANEVPHHPYYGSIDATPLFLILVGQHAAWTGTLDLFHELQDHVERALDWMAHYGDTNGDGYIDYESESEKGLINQGWKDSGDAIVNGDGSLATPPIALVEVQGYAYLAKMSIADLYERSGNPSRAQQLRQEAEGLRDRFNREFWLPDQDFFALALQAHDHPAAVISSNPGQALWTGIVAQDKAPATVKRLMAPDMFSGWGIRTLSSDAVRYNPLGYHLGTVWPHDNSIIAAGFRRYGFDDEAFQILDGLIRASMEYPEFRLPELFSGFSRAEYTVPVRFPVACHPQAWAAGSIPFMITTALGLQPEAFGHRLRIVRPFLPGMTHHLELHGLRVGEARVDLAFDQNDDQPAKVTVLKVEGKLDVQVESKQADRETRDR